MVRRLRVFAFTAILACSPARSVFAQGPRPPSDSVLARPVTVAFQNTTLVDALSQLRHDLAVPLAYSGDLLPARRRVTVVAQTMSVGDLLTQILDGTGLEVVSTRDGTLVVVRGAVGGTALSASERETAISRALMATGVRQLDEVIVMGSAVANAPEREQPTAVAVVGANTLAGAAHTRIGDLIRTLIPGVVLWDAGPSGGPPQVTSVRGVSSFTSRGLKTYVDGVELASPEFFPLVDGRSMQQLEVMRGPQGAALYGPDALNGVLQVETRRGEPGGAARVTRVSATAGPHEPGDVATSALWQDHAASVALNGAQAGLEAGVSYARTGRVGDVPWQQIMTGQAGGTVRLGPVTLQSSARVGRFEYGLYRVGNANPVSVGQQLDEQAAGVTLLHSIAPSWQQTLTVGFHHVNGPRDPNRSFLLDLRLPLGANHEDASRSSVRYATAVDVGDGPTTATFSGGVEHSRRVLTRSVRLSVASRELVKLFEDDLNSTGAYGQVRLRLASRLVVSGGARAEWSSTVNPDQGAAWASTIGASWAQPLGSSTLRLRSAWGRGLRLPEPGMGRSMATATVQQVANAELIPERQSGIEVGADLYLAQGSWLRATLFDQRADNLIQQVRLRNTGTDRAFQFQNVGAISNRGAELEAGARLGSLSVVALAYFTESTVLEVAQRYTGYLRVDDALPDVPKSVGSLAVRYGAGRVTAEIGGSWLGSWVGFDRAAAIAVEQGQLASRDTPRDFWIDYPSVLRPWLAVSTDIGSGVTAFLRADNPAQTTRFIRDNLSPPLGRTTVIGVTVQR